MAAPFLTRAVAEARERVRAAKGSVPPVPAAPPPSFADALRAPGLSVIAEVKRASPSRGRIADIPDPAALAAAYVAGGAAAVSVLTEPRHFRGSLDDLTRVATRVAVPVLRKDFIVDPWQLHEARAHGAAAVLLIVAALPDDDLAALLRAAADLGLDVLIETHRREEVDRAVAAHARSAAGTPLVVGVNARDLRTLEVDPARFAQVVRHLPDDAVVVAESGVRGPDDARRLAALGADAVLVGEHVALADDPAAAVGALRAAAPSGSAVLSEPMEAT